MWAYRALFSIHSLPSSVTLFEASGGWEPSTVLTYVWVNFSIGCTPERLSHQWEDNTPTSTPMAKIVHSVSFEKCKIPKCNLFRYSMGTSLLGDLYENRILLQLYTIMLKWLQWNGVRQRLGHRTGKQWSQPNQSGRRICPMSAGCPLSAKGDDGDVRSIRRSPIKFE